jgi:hypothetical protein
MSGAVMTTNFGQSSISKAAHGLRESGSGLSTAIVYMKIIVAKCMDSLAPHTR